MTTPAIDNPPPSIAATARLVQLASAPQSGCNCSSDTNEVDAGLCPIPTLQFPRFFAGQLVQPADLTAIEQRIFSHEQLRARHTIGWGVSCGFRVAIDGTAQQAPAPVGTVELNPVLTSGIVLKGATLRVEGGYGIDRYGRDVYMANNYSVSLEQLFAERQARITKAMGDPWCAIPGCQPTPPTHYCVAVRYKECLDQPVPSYAQQCGTPKTICEYSRVSECVEIRIFGDNEFPTLPAPASTQTWCGLPAKDLTLAALWDALIKIPQGTTDVASTVGAATGAAADAPSDAYTALAGSVAGTDQERGSCLDLLHMARACDPCIAWPWIPLACFTSDGTTVSAPDCRVRRTIYSLQEIEAAVVKLFCAMLEIVQRAEAAAPGSTPAATIP
jgi:hypothetical protein